MRSGFKSLVLIGFCVSFFQSCKSPSGSSALSDDEVQTGPKIAIGGYLPDVEEKRWVVIQNGKIQKFETKAPEGMVVYETEGYILPGLIDLHNHLSYNILPLWSEAKGQFLNRFEWRNREPAKTLYGRAVKFNMTAITGSTECASSRHAELQAMTGGVTTIQGGHPSVRAGTGFLTCGQGFGVRNTEARGEVVPGKSVKSALDIVSPFPLRFYKANIAPKIQSGMNYDEALEASASAAGYAEYVADFETKTRLAINKGLDDGSLTAVIAHLAEGRPDDPFNAAEYGLLKTFGLARKGMVLIHGLGLTLTDWRHAGDNGIAAVWSPLSNLLLYGQTLDVDAILAANPDNPVLLSLGSDWTPSGSKTLLDELKIARRHLDSVGSRVTNAELMAMVTTNPARAIGAGNRLGQVKPGFAADIMVIKRLRGNAPDSLVAADQRHVQLVVIDGRVVYGDAEILRRDSTAIVDEVIPGSAACDDIRKGFVVTQNGDAETALAAVDPTAIRFRSFTALNETLNARKEEHAAKVRAGQAAGIEADLSTIPKIFVCDDPAYQPRIERLFNEDLPRSRNQQSWRALRSDMGLSGNWTP